MFRKTGMALMMLAMFSVIGGHWAVFQTIAWAKMMRDYSRTSSLVEAAEKTFNGEHPCAMCKSIEKNRAAEEKAPPVIKADKKADVFITAISCLPSPRITGEFSHRLVDLIATQRTYPPSVPVPLVAPSPLA